ncbi:unnamed protein product [Phytophthora fragariaefolia]|uniref:Unnamed protein product n=1 Tax=Phytophthora fragariaefolia TaxID=1490495 RepID=A0A9W7D5Y3_9STRA|nr:unnamed protein product [Phytophthora fragariaefolia]
MKLPNKRELGVWIPLDKDMTVFAMNGDLDATRLNEWIDALGDSGASLPNEDEVHVGSEDENDIALIVKLLRVFRKLLENEGSYPPATALDIHHHIDTGNAAPNLLKRRRQAQSEDKIINENVKQMLGAGVIEEGQGAWGFPVVLVQKKDGEVRFCILVAPEDRDQTAFTTKKGFYRCIWMPFGLTNAPSTFQRMMNHVLRGLTWSTCLVYLDDIVVFTRGGIERHTVELACVLERLSMAGMTLKLKKCNFAMTSMVYLGHELTGFGSIMAPMTKLLRKDVEWQWGSRRGVSEDQTAVDDEVCAYLPRF